MFLSSIPIRLWWTTMVLTEGIICCFAADGWLISCVITAAVVQLRGWLSFLMFEALLLSCFCFVLFLQSVKHPVALWSGHRLWFLHHKGSSEHFSLDAVLTPSPDLSPRGSWKDQSEFKADCSSVWSAGRSGVTWPRRRGTTARKSMRTSLLASWGKEVTWDRAAAHKYWWD